MNNTGAAGENLEKRKDVLRKREHLNNIFKEVFKTPQGKECLQEIMRLSGAFERDVNTQVEHTFILEGQRRLAIGIAKYVYGKNTAAKVLQMLEKNETI